MNTKKNISHILTLIFLCSVNGALFGATFIKNNSMWNIKYKKSDASTSTPEMLLRPGEKASVNLNQPLSIRRSGIGSSLVTSWHNVPTKELIKKIPAPTYISLGTSYLEKDTIISIGTSYTGGWSFSAALEN